MATVKFTVRRGALALKDVTVAAGSAEAQSDTISLNIDYTNAKKADVIHMLEGIKGKIHASKWPPL